VAQRSAMLRAGLITQRKIAGRPIAQPSRSNHTAPPSQPIRICCRIRNVSMPDFRLQRDWKQFLSYEVFERVASRIVMLFISVIIVYSIVLMAIALVDQIRLNSTYLDTESLRDVFGSILTILILIEFNHSIALALSTRSGILQARPIVLITILVIARKVILLDFTTATFEQLVGVGVLALAFGLLFWLISARGAGLPPSPSP
jgi:uncharacterized membrane protein (DUF373 family)